MKRAPVVALDVGTSSVRAVLISSTGGRVLFRARAGGTRDGLASVEAEVLWREVAQVLDAVEERLAGSGETPAACGISAFWHSALLAQPDGRPVGPVHLWSDPDPRFGRAAADLRRRVDARAARDAVGAPIHPSLPAAKALALLAELGASARRRIRLLGFEDLLALRLFGRLEKSLSMASGTGLWQADRADWHEPLLAALGLAPERLAPVERATDETRLLAGPARARWPHLAGAPWRLPRGDGALSNLGLCAAGPVAGLTVGTSAALRVLDRPTGAGALPRALFRYFLDAGRPLVGGALSDGGNLVAHMAAIAGVRPPSVEAAARALAPGADGLLVLPGLWGERSPGWPDASSGGILGLRAGSAPAAVVRSAMDAVGAGLAAVAEALDAAYGAPFARRVRAGGRAIARSGALAQIAADAIGLPLDIPAGAEESSALGAAALALAGIGRPAPAPARVLVTFEPRPGGREVYRRIGERQASVRAAGGEGSRHDDGREAPGHSDHGA